MAASPLDMELSKYWLLWTADNFSGNIFITPIASLVTGIVIGTIEILYFNKIFIQKSFTGKIVYKSIICPALIFSFLAILSAIAKLLDLFKTNRWSS